MKPTCLTCSGQGKVMDGVFMHSRPSSYGDYDEVWTPCTHCGGTGKTWKDIFIHLRWQIKILLERIRYGIPKEEDEIPY